MNPTSCYILLKKNRVAGLMALVLFLYGCIEPYDYQPGDVESLLVVDGKITNQPGPQDLRLYLSNDYGQTSLRGLSNAEVTLFEVEGPSESFVEMDPGLYRFFGNVIRPKPGHTYYIEIKRGASKIYRSVPETMPDPVKPDSVYFIIEQEDIVNDFGQQNLKYVIHILIDTPVKSGERNFYLKWRVDEAYSSTEFKWHPLVYPKTCYIPIEPFSQNIDIYSTESISGGRLEGKKVLSREPQPYDEFNERHYFNVSQLSITRECYLYWEKLKIVSNPTGSFLDKIPGAIIGNVYNIHDDKEYVLGYFSVAGEEMARTFTLPGLMNPIYVYPKCLGWDVPDYCYNCLVIENSTLERPAYWGE